MPATTWLLSELSARALREIAGEPWRPPQHPKGCDRPNSRLIFIRTIGAISDSCKPNLRLSGPVPPHTPVCGAGRSAPHPPVPPGLRGCWPIFDRSKKPSSPPIHKLTIKLVDSVRISTPSHLRSTKMVLALLIITACWMLILSLVLAICLSARQGDRQQLKQAHPYPSDVSASAHFCSPIQEKIARE